MLQMLEAKTGKGKKGKLTNVITLGFELYSTGMALLYLCSLTSGGEPVSPSVSSLSVNFV